MDDKYMICSMNYLLHNIFFTETIKAHLNAEAGLAHPSSQLKQLPQAAD